MNANILADFNVTPEAQNEEIFEWIALLESVSDAKESYTMIELGAGYGRWTARAAKALRDRHPGMPMHFIAVEAEPTHFQWMQEHLKKNDVDLADCKLVQAPVSGKRETVHFTIGHPEEWYGQAIIPSAKSGYGNWPKAKVVTMEAVIIPDLIADLGEIDLIDMDIQGAELPCVESSIDILCRKVRRLFISTHSDEIHDRLAVLLGKQGWTNEASYSLQRQHNTEFGPIMFGDGIQYWVNSGIAFHPLST